MLTELHSCGMCFLPVVDLLPAYPRFEFFYCCHWDAWLCSLMCMQYILKSLSCDMNRSKHIEMCTHLFRAPVSPSSVWDATTQHHHSSGDSCLDNAVQGRFEGRQRQLGTPLLICLWRLRFCPRHSSCPPAHVPRTQHIRVLVLLQDVCWLQHLLIR